MAAPTVTEQRVRLEAVLAASGMVTTLLLSQDVAIPSDGLPAYAVTARGGSRERTTANTEQTTRNFEVLVLYHPLPDRPTPEDQRDAVIAVEDVMETIIDFLSTKRPRLELDGKPLAAMLGYGNITDDGAQIYEWGGKTYGGVVYTIPVNLMKVGR